MKILHLFANDIFEPRSQKIMDSSKSAGYEVVSILKPSKKSYFWYFINSTKKILEDRSDIINAHRISGYLPAIMAKILGNKSKIIYDKHDTHKLDFIFDYLIFLSDFIFTNSKLHLQKISKFLKSGGDVLHNYSYFKPINKKQNKEYRKKYGFKEIDFIILFQGSISRLSSPENLVNAMKLIKNKNIKLAIVGWPIEKKYWEKIKKNFTKNVKFLGSVTYDEMNGIVGMSDVGTVMFKKCVMTDNGDPNKLWEAMACKKPVIVTDVESIAPVVRKYKNGLIGNSPRELAKAIVEMTNKKRYMEFVKNTPDLTWDMEFVKYNKVLKKMMKK